MADKTETPILDERAVSEIEARPARLNTRFEELVILTPVERNALCATVKHLRARLDSIKSKTAWHRDGIGPDVPVMQERYDNLIAQRNDLQSQLEQLRTRLAQVEQERDAETKRADRWEARAKQLGREVEELEKL